MYIKCLWQPTILWHIYCILYVLTCRLKQKPLYPPGLWNIKPNGPVSVVAANVLSKIVWQCKWHNKNVSGVLRSVAKWPRRHRPYRQMDIYIYIHKNPTGQTQNEINGNPFYPFNMSTHTYRETDEFKCINTGDCTPITTHRTPPTTTPHRCEQGLCG